MERAWFARDMSARQLMRRPSLFFSSGTSWKESRYDQKATSGSAEPGQKDYVMERRDKGSDIVLVASEPLTFERGKSLITTDIPDPLIVR